MSLQIRPWTLRTVAGSMDAMEEGFLPGATSYGTRLRKERRGRTSSVQPVALSLAALLPGISMWLRRVVIESVGTPMVEKGRALEL